MSLKLKLILRSEVSLLKAAILRHFSETEMEKTAEEKSKLYFPLAKHREFGYSKKVNKLVSFMMIYFHRLAGKREEKKSLTKARTWTKTKHNYLITIPARRVLIILTHSGRARTVI